MPVWFLAVVLLATGAWFVVHAVVAGIATLFVCGAFDVGRLEAYGLATIVAVVTWQVWSLTGRR